MAFSQKTPHPTSQYFFSYYIWNLIELQLVKCSTDWTRWQSLCLLTVCDIVFPVPSVPVSLLELVVPSVPPRTSVVRLLLTQPPKCFPAWLLLWVICILAATPWYSSRNNKRNNHFFYCNDWKIFYFFHEFPM